MKKEVSDKIGSALLVSQTDGRVKRVVGVFQSRSSSSASPNEVQLKTALVGTAGAPTTLLPLAEALDGEKWKVLVHFCNGTFKMGQDTADVKQTVVSDGNIVGVRAVLTMAGQQPMPEADYALEAFIDSWVDPPGADDNEDGDAGDAQRRGDVGSEAEDVTVEDPDVEVELGEWPTVLGHIRIMENLDLTVIVA